jgi:ABC-type microcin C transport system permease subunit YejB
MYYFLMTCLFRGEQRSSLFFMDLLIFPVFLLGCVGKVGFGMTEDLYRVLLNELYMRRLQDVVNELVQDLERMRTLLEQVSSDEQEG